MPARQRYSGPDHHGRNYFFFGSAALASVAFGISPITVFSGQTENAGHFLQPATIAMGHRVMIIPFGSESPGYAFALGAELGWPERGAAEAQARRDPLTRGAI